MAMPKEEAMSEGMRRRGEVRRLKYKESYEKFKLTFTILHLGSSLLSLLIGPTMVLSYLSNFLLLYLYIRLAVYEINLRRMGSRIHLWWLIHRFLCILLALLLLTWPPRRPLRHSTQLQYFAIYVALVQILQYRYQMARLYTLRAVSKVSPLQITTDTVAVHWSTRRLLTLVPFLLVIHAGQGWLAWRYGLVGWNVDGDRGRYLALAGVMAVFAGGNLVTTAIRIWQKTRLS